MFQNGLLFAGAAGFVIVIAVWSVAMPQGRLATDAAEASHYMTAGRMWHTSEMHGGRIIDWCGKSRSEEVSTTGMKNKIRATLQEDNPDWDFQGAGGYRLDFSQLTANCDSYNLEDGTYINAAYYVKDSLLNNCTTPNAIACVPGTSSQYICLNMTNTCHRNFAKIFFKTANFREDAPNPNWHLINHETAHVLGFCDVSTDDPDCNSGSSDSVVHDYNRDWPSWPDHLSVTDQADKSEVPY